MRRGTLAFLLVAAWAPPTLAQEASPPAAEPLWLETWAGARANDVLTGWTDLDSLIGTRWGTGIALGGGLAILLTLFHLFIEERLEPVAMNADMSPEIDIERTMRVLKIVPRVGVVILLMIVSLMVYAARGL